ncbi:SH3 domain-containing protein [Microbulbifer sp. CAU 1566]|uniref:SH3 domain-containing protein n=1 Tax=Microbulbifer sp. CAU 1566 TaxID=2933269 RepID=UPI00200674A5|nr:SH3 domain-containing protein [Microbulbifer sp. CAU 1566]MCK7597811.1 SH3 domain-containing protein [Microbulbifer sp. CAU 1566]
MNWQPGKYSFRILSTTSLRLAALVAGLMSVGPLQASESHADGRDVQLQEDSAAVIDSFSAQQFGGRQPEGLASDAEQVIVGAVFLNLYTGPGRGYVIDHVVEYGEPLWLLKRRTDWVKVMTRSGKTGWAKISELDEVFTPEGEQLVVPTPGIDDYREQGLRLSFSYGDFAGANSLGVSLGYRFTANLSAELRAAQTIGAYSDSQTYQVAVLHKPFPQWRFSPYFLLGTGINTTSPNATIVATEDRQDTTMLTGVGVTAYLSRRFALRVEAANHYLLTSRENNQEIVEWKLGFDVFM